MIDQKLKKNVFDEKVLNEFETMTVFPYHMENFKATRSFCFYVLSLDQLLLKFRLVELMFSSDSQKRIVEERPGKICFNEL